MTSLFYFILAFRHCLNFNKLCTFFALLSAVVCFPSYSSIISLSLITLRLAVSLFDFSFLSKSCDVSDDLITLERVDNTSARSRDNDNDNDAVSNANDATVAAADVLRFLIVQLVNWKKCRQTNYS